MNYFDFNKIVSRDRYPIVLIPDIILKHFEGYNLNEAEKTQINTGIEHPKHPKNLILPPYPTNYKVVTNEVVVKKEVITNEVEFNWKGIIEFLKPKNLIIFIILIWFLGVFVFFFFAVILSGQPILMILGGGAFGYIIYQFFDRYLITYFSDIYSMFHATKEKEIIKDVKEVRETKIELPREEFENNLKKYQNTVKELEKDHKLYFKFYDFKTEQNNSIIASRKDLILNKTYYSIHSKITEGIRTKSIPQKGKKELDFLELLIERINHTIMADMEVGYYYPDISIKLKETGFWIDVEIDEPYSYSDKKPIHFLDGEDEERNKFFLDVGWIILRFTEKQVSVEPLKCIKLINNVIDIIEKPKNNNTLLPNMSEKRWTYEEALIMSNKKYRNTY